jgi:hypothetical protein
VIIDKAEDFILNHQASAALLHLTRRSLENFDRTAGVAQYQARTKTSHRSTDDYCVQRF